MALDTFGEALHTVTDGTSPSHVGYQVWQGIPVVESLYYIVGYQGPITTNLAAVQSHSDGESTISEEFVSRVVENILSASMLTLDSGSDSDRVRFDS